MQLISEMMPILFLALFLWLLGLSYLTWNVQKHIKKLGRGVTQGNLLKVLEEVKKSESSNKKILSDIQKEIKSIKVEGLTHIQKMGFTRFNPFNETGGDHSFSLCLLDDKNNGFVLSCLHARDKSRVYSKVIELGKSEIKLSREEKKALSQAIND